jgi:sn-1 stearoyl-lipid 9-desaturase
MAEDSAFEGDAFKVNSLTGLDRASPVEGEVVWDPVRSIWNTAMFLTAVILGPLTVSWSALIVFLVTAGITLCAGHSVGFHRRLIHRSFDCPKWLERTLIWFGTAVGMGGPIWTIRLHDTRDWAQRQPDCHWFLRHGRPLFVDGFYYLNFRLRLKHPPGFDPGPGIGDDPFYNFLQRTWMAQQIPIAIALFLLGGWPWVIWGVCIRVSACTTMHWYISNVAHTHGPQDWTVDDAAIQAHNVPLLAIPTMGEAWHCNHHAFPKSARHGLYPGQIDLGWHFIRLLERLGMVSNVKTPANLPPRPGITPVTPRALGAAPAGQARLSRLPNWTSASQAYLAGRPVGERSSQ